MSSNNRVQGLCIHSFPHDGISIQGILPGTARHPGSNGNQIYWNLVGTDVRGMAALPNGHDTPPGLWGGIYVKVLPNSPGIALGNHILENVASGNRIEGIGIANCPDVGDVANNRVERCYVGIDITGAGPLGNGHQGVYIGEGAHHNLIEQNWIGANGFDGVGIVGFGPSGLITHSNTLNQNRIGVDVNLNPMPNTWHGVAVGSYGGTVWGFAPDNVIINNTIAWNIHTGVAVTEARPVGDNDTSRNRITQNAIHHNGHIDPGYLGIDLDFEPGVTPNDPGEVEDHRAPVGKPVRVKIQVIPPSAPTTVTLGWAAEPGATQYSVYSSTTLTGPFPAAWTIEASGIAGLTWSEPLTVASKFYVVVAFP